MVQFSYPLLDKTPNKMTAGNLLNGYSIKYLYRQTESEMNDKNFDSGSSILELTSKIIRMNLSNEQRTKGYKKGTSEIGR
jgi:hypothetical protein